MNLNVSITPEISLAFSTPLSIGVLPNASPINEGLERAILKRRRADRSNTVSNVGGWHSTPDLLEWPEPEVRMLLGEVDRTLQKINALPSIMETRRLDKHKRASYHASAWANYNEAGHYNNLHVHAGNHWSAVYYVATGLAAEGHPHNGKLELRDPRPAAAFGALPGFNFGNPLTIKPEPGLMVLFPAWLEHWVHPFYGEGHRISVAVNIALDGA